MEILETIRAAAPFALFAITGLCVAVMFLNMHRDAGNRAKARTTFGDWPETRAEAPSEKSPAVSRFLPDTIARRLSLGLAVAIAGGEALFRAFPDGLS